MFARVVELAATSHAAAEFVQVLHEKVLPTIRSQAGCMGAFVKLPNGSAVVTGMSLWASRRDAERFRLHGYSGIEAMMLPFLVSKPTVHTIEVPELGKIVMQPRAMTSKTWRGFGSPR